MNLRLQLTTGTLVFLAGVAMMVYSYFALQGMPYVTAMVMLWLCMVEYAVGRAWWSDVREAYEGWRERRTHHRTQV
jgi:hypothetical protein